jgi:D-galactarolactone isomerase
VTQHPVLQAPPGACDCAIHIYDPAFTPEGAPSGRVLPWATVDAYKDVQRQLGTTRAVVVQPTAYGFDNRCTMAAVAALGDARGVATVGPDVTDAALDALQQAGIRGARFQMLGAPLLPWSALEPVAARIAPFGWHIQLQMDGRLLAEREAVIAGLPCPVVIDHIGKFLEPSPVTHPGFLALLRLLDTGRCWLKISGAYEVSRSGPPHFEDVGTLARAAIKAAPERVVWGTNWPHVGVDAAQDDSLQLDLLLRWAEDDAMHHRILVTNAAALYGFTA